jgi:hypothetical protein
VRLLLAAALAVVFSAPAYAASHSSHFAVSGIATIIFNDGDGHAQRLNEGNNPIGGPTQIDCGSSGGCLVTVQSMIGLNASTAQWRVCSAIDGKIASPGRPVQAAGNPLYANTGSTVQSMKVSTGTHTAQTFR